MVFQGRYSPEVYQEYGEWLPYITDVFVSIIDSETGNFLHYPFEGSIMEQPYMTMNIMRVLQVTYREVLADKHKKQMEKASAKRRSGGIARRRR